MCCLMPETVLWRQESKTLATSFLIHKTFNLSTQPLPCPLLWGLLSHDPQVSQNSGF